MILSIHIEKWWCFTSYVSISKTYQIIFDQLPRAYLHPANLSYKYPLSCAIYIGVSQMRLPRGLFFSFFLWNLKGSLLIFFFNLEIWSYRGLHNDSSYSKQMYFCPRERCQQAGNRRKRVITFIHLWLLMTWCAGMSMCVFMFVSCVCGRGYSITWHQAHCRIEEISFSSTYLSGSRSLQTLVSMLHLEHSTEGYQNWNSQDLK